MKEPEAVRRKAFDLGIGVSVVFDDARNPDIQLTEWRIHGVGSNSASWDAGMYLVGLSYERMAYEENNYDMGGQAITAKYWDSEDNNQLVEYEIIDTPYCWNPGWLEEL